MFNKVDRLICYLVPFVTIVMLCTGCSFLGFKESSKVIAMNDLPPVIKPLAEKETEGCKIIEVEKEEKDGSTIYAVTYDRAGTTMEIEYTPDGRLISKGKEQNHGPVYYKRDPKSFEKFKPVCKSNQLEQCTRDEINNAYDNAILYTDYFPSNATKAYSQDNVFHTLLGLMEVKTTLYDKDLDLINSATDDISGDKNKQRIGIIPNFQKKVDCRRKI